MADFAVHHEGLPEGSARWALHVDAVNDRVLLVDEDKTFYWKALSECTLGAVHTPSQPTAVVIVQPQTGPQIVQAPALPNRQMRRNGVYN